MDGLSFLGIELTGQGGKRTDPDDLISPDNRSAVVSDRYRDVVDAPAVENMDRIDLR